MIGAPVGVDDEVGGEVGPCRLDQDMHPAAFPCPADRIADDPAHGVTSGDRPWADELLAFLKGDVRHLTRGGIDLIERSEEHTSELQSLMRISYAVFCLKKTKKH